jgi:predicted ATPase
MQIKKFTVSQLHGMLDLEIEFNEDLTIIVGRNGSGKTSALNLIADILRINIKGILATNFIKAELFLIDEGRGNVSIVVSREADIPCMEVAVNNEEVGKIFLNSGIVEERWENYFTLENHKSLTLLPKQLTLGSLDKFFAKTDDGEAKKIIGDGVNLTFVRLDRTIITTDPSGVFLGEPGSSVAEQKNKKSVDRRINEPIDIIRNVTRSNFLSYKSAQERIKSQAIEQLLRLQFLENGSNTVGKSRKRPTQEKLEQQITELERKVSHSSLVQETPGLNGPVEKFFKETRRLLELSFKPRKQQTGRRTKAEEELESILLSRQWRVQKLLEIFEAEQTQTAQAYSRLKQYLDSAQKFFDDSEKDLSFHPKNFELCFRPNSSGATVISESDLRSIVELSSGEKQILIILTYFAFLANSQSIFMIDEPELSLHLKWQSNLVREIAELRPAGCQIIMATHSPEIAGPATEKCYPLVPKKINP